MKPREGPGPQEMGTLEIQADVSFAPGGGRSIQGVMVMYGGSCGHRVAAAAGLYLRLSCICLCVGCCQAERMRARKAGTSTSLAKATTLLLSSQ